MTKYDPIGEFLIKTGQDEVVLSYEQIQDILGFELPKSASKYSEWWANGGHTQAHGWLDHSYKVKMADLKAKRVCFQKTGTPSKETDTEMPYVKASKTRTFHAKKVKSNTDIHMPAKPNAKTIEVCGHTFTYIQDIEPERGADGRVIEYAPQSQYPNRQGKSLHNYGSGTFCRFSIHAGNWPGVYLWVVDGEIIYIGETVKLAQRFNTGYGNIEGVNCYAGGQKTNCKMNKVVLELAKIGKTVNLYFYNTQDYKRVELELLHAINTQYNVKDNV